MKIVLRNASVAWLPGVFSFVVAVSALGLAPQAWSQTASAADTIDASDIVSDDETVDEVVVTGSRLKRDTYSSIAPLQVISGQISREVGLIDAGKILQESSATAGVQIDLTFQGFVLDNGPGASTVDLRGLGAERTLVLINGRRAAPSGVEGAPIAPDLNLVPAALVQQYDVLLDGASSVYGSDAIAGVTNIILRKDFNGLELEAFTSVPAQSSSAGVQNTITGAWGFNTDRGFFGIAAEYFDTEAVTFADREWTSQCDRHVERTETGDIRHLDLYYQQTLLMEPSVCKSSLLAGRFAELSGRFGSVYYTPGFSNSGIPNFSEGALYSVPIDTTGDGTNDIDYIDYNLNGTPEFQAGHLFPDFDRLSVMTYGEYTFSGEWNLTPFFEVQYNQRETYAFSGVNQFFPTVPANNPYNPCNPNGVRGVDCGDAYDGLLSNPSYVAYFADYYAGLCAANGIPPASCSPATFGLLEGPAGPVAVQPIVQIQGDRSEVWSEIEQYRVVGGLKGDLPFMNFASFEDWTFDVAAVYTESEGTSLRRGILNDRLNLSLAAIEDPNSPGTIICGVDNDNNGIPDGTDGCVPLDLFTPELYANPGSGDIPQDAKDYLFGDRTFLTKLKQELISGYMTGEMFQLPAGAVSGGIGFEFREDTIDSDPNDVAEFGLLWNFFSDRGAVGSRTTKEAFAEIELPLIAGKPGFEELTLNLSGRYTKDEYYDSANTYSIKLGYRPVESLLLRGTVGTSYRAPNLRENFLAGSTGFLSLVDPCVIPPDARDPLGNYDPTLDKRPAYVMANCAANGADPTMLDNNGITTYGMEISTGGSLDLEPETSDSISVGFAWDQPFFDSFDMTIGMNYYDIEIEQEIINPTSQFMINNCYYDAEGDSAFCSRIARDTDQFIELIDAGFINRDSLKTRGFDYNIAFDADARLFDRSVDIGFELAANHTLENSRTFIDDDGDTDYTDFNGRFGFPEWKGRATLRADMADYRITWSTRFIGEVEEPATIIGPYGFVPDDVLSDTCLGPAQGDELCQNVGTAGSYVLHDISFYYLGDQWTVGGGFRNLFNESPPLVDGDAVFSVNNVPLGAGYDLNGRMAFFNVAVNFE
jgi:iron complex outermembrane receptor protein